MKISKTDKDLIKSIRAGLADKTDSERHAIFQAITKDYCYFCGDKHMPCYCNDDE